MMSATLRRVIAVLVMGAGCVGVSGLMYYMNELTQPPAPQAREAAKDFKVEKQPKKQQQRKKIEKPKPKRTTTTARRAPMPNVTTALSGMSFDLPQFQGRDAMSAEELLGNGDANQKVVMTEETVDEMPKPRTRVAPQYPATARQRGIQGHVLMTIIVSERGDVERVKVLEAEPPGVFDGVATAAVRQWSFEPAKYKGAPVPSSVSQRIPFRLN